MSDNLLDSELLKIFCTVHALKQVNLAAKALGVTPSSISQAIRRLESTLQTELFYHDQRPLKLTPAGLRLLAEGEPIVKSLELLQSHFLTMDHPEVALRLGMGETITATLSPWLISTLYERVAQLEVHSSLNQTLTQSLRNGDLDICIYSHGLLNENQWMRIPIFEEEYLVVTSAEHDPVLSLSDLQSVAASRPYISYTQESYDRELSDEFLHSVNIRPHSRIQTTSSFCLVGLVAQLNGWALLPPTNIWAAGKAFAKKVHWSPIADEFKFRRRMWVLGDPKFEREILWIAELSRSLFVTHTLSELTMIDEELCRYACALPSLNAH